MSKISIRFFNNVPVRAVWNDAKNNWFFSVLDILSVMRNEPSYEKNRNYWKYLKAKLKKEDSQLVSLTTQLKLTAKDGKKYLSDALDFDGVYMLASEFPGKVSSEFLKWLNKNDETVDAKSKQKAYNLFDDTVLEEIEIGTIKGLQQIHAYLFSGLYPFAGQIRTINIAKGGFVFASAIYLGESLASIEKMPDNTFDEIVKKYVEMNIAHPFMEGNGRSTRIWLDMMLKKAIKKCVDWSKIDKKDYLDAMKQSVTDTTWIKQLLLSALTEKILDREMFMKGVDYSYYYEEVSD